MYRKLIVSPHLRFIPKLHYLHFHVLFESRRVPESLHAATYRMERLPYELDKAYLAVAQFVELLELELESLRQSKPAGGTASTWYVVDPWTRDRLSFLVDGFLDAARRAQDSLIGYLQLDAKRSLPNSMHAYFNEIQRGRDLVPAFDAVIASYWQSSGATLKDYRDVSQHHAVVGTQAKILISGGQVRGLHLLLPSNPEVKSAKLLQHESPQIHVLPYMVDQLRLLYGLVGVAVEYLCAKLRVSGTGQAFHFANKETFSEFGREAVPSVMPNVTVAQVDAEISNVLGRIQPLS